MAGGCGAGWGAWQSLPQPRDCSCTVLCFLKILRARWSLNSSGASPNSRQEHISCHLQPTLSLSTLISVTYAYPCFVVILFPLQLVFWLFLFDTHNIVNSQNSLSNLPFMPSLPWSKTAIWFGVLRLSPGKPQDVSERRPGKSHCGRGLQDVTFARHQLQIKRHAEQRNPSLQRKTRAHRDFTVKCEIWNLEIKLHLPFVRVFKKDTCHEPFEILSHDSS